MSQDEEVPFAYSAEAHAHHMAERGQLTDAARESSRTFDQAVLAFGAAVFGASVAFLKDVAPKPEVYTIKWLALSWGCFTFGLLAVVLSFLFSHRACMARIDESEALLKNIAKPKNHWAGLTDICNFLCVLFLFVGVALWGVFAIENLATSGGKNEPADATIRRTSQGACSPEDSATAAQQSTTTPTTKEVRQKMKQPDSLGPKRNDQAGYVPPKTPPPSNQSTPSTPQSPPKK